jgi:hypothetical protein
MRWTDQPPDIAPAPVADLVRTLSAVGALAVLSRLRTSSLVFFNPVCRVGILAHLRTQGTELGGLLIGSAYLPGADLPSGSGSVACIEDFLPSQRFRSSRVSLAMETEIWDRARDMMANERRVIVGWYHSHPNLGAFFSGTDRATQRAFFNMPYSVGLVIDPIREEEAWFLGPDCEPVMGGSILASSLRNTVASDSQPDGTFDRH